MKIKKTILESLTQQERAMLAGYSPEFVSSISNALASLRKGGRQVDVNSVVQQMVQLPGYKNNPEIQKFMRTNGAMQNLVAPMANIRSSRPSQPGIAPPPSFVGAGAQQQYQQALQRQTPVPGRQSQVAPPPAWVGGNNVGFSSMTPQDLAMAQQGQQRIAGQIPDDLDQQTMARVAREQQQKAAGTAMTPQQAQARQQLATSTTIPPGFSKRNKPRGAQKENMNINKSVIKEFMSPTGMLKNILGAIGKMKPEELIAIANFVNSLLNSNKPGMAQTSMSSTSISTESKSMNKYQKVIKENILEQMKTKLVTEHYLNEGPMSSIWQGIKDAGSNVAGAMGLQSMAGQAQNIGVDENTKKLGQELTKLIGKVNQQRQKFNASILKNSESVSQYHDLVLHLWEMYNQNLQALGPFGQQLQRQVQDAIGNFHYDLTSEKEQIDTFLQSLKDVKSSSLGNSEVMGKSARASVQDKRAAEAAANQRMTSTSTKAQPSKGNFRALDALQANITPQKEDLKKKFLTAHTPAEKQQAYRDLEKLLIKTSKRGSKKDAEKED